MTRVTLVDVYLLSRGMVRKPTPEAIDLLFKLLQERDSKINISHKGMPSLAQHKAFVESEPYLEWFLIRADEVEGKPLVGSIYITRNNEIGIFILKAYQGKDFGTAALNMMKTRYSKTRLLANIAPDNAASQAFFESHGFKKIQHTYELTR